MEEKDKALIEIAKDLISKRYKEDRHHIAAALRTTSGKFLLGYTLKPILEGLRFVVKQSLLVLQQQAGILKLIQ